MALVAYIFRVRNFNQRLLYNISQMRLSQLRSVPIDNNSIVFAGDSQTQYCDFAGYLKKANIVNMGVAGESTGGLKKRVTQIADSAPAIIFIQSGINDIKESFQIKVSIDNIREVIKVIRCQSPETKIFIQSIFPSVPKLNNNIVAYNKELSQLCDINLIPFIDLYPSFIYNGALMPQYDCGDGLHLTSAGYEKWTEILKPYL